MPVSDVFRDCLVNLDTQTARSCWAQVAPDMPGPASEFEALIVLHYARTTANVISPVLRIYSHEWLLDRALPSGLPDHLKPKPQRIEPRKVEAVGVSVKSLSGAGAPLAKAMERAMSDAVAECYADGMRAPAFIRARMEEARRSVLSH